MAKKELLLVYPTFHKTGGIERFLSDLMSQFKEMGIPFNIGYSQYKLTHDLSNDAVHIPCVSKPTFLKTLFFCLISRFYISPKKYFVHTQGANYLSPHIVTAHSCHKAWFLESLNALSPLSLPWFKKVLNPVHYVSIAVETWQYQFSGTLQIVCVSQLVQKQLQKYYRIPEEKLSVVHNGVNQIEFYPLENGRSEHRERMKIELGDKIILFVANEFKRKNLSVVLNALKELPENYRLFIVGRGDEHTYRKQAESLKLSENRIKYFGSRSNLRDFYQAADVFVLPTQHDAFALVVLEAMACGTPSITTKEAGVAEIMTHGKDGLIMDDPFDHQELVRNILYAVNNRQTLSDGAVLTAKSNTNRICAEKMQTIYNMFNK